MSELEVAIKAAKEGGAILLKHFKNEIQVRSKNPRDIVTEADVESEKKIISIIKDVFPTHSILAEESGREDLDAGHLWVIDPLDGTSNFFKGSRDFCVLISYVRNSEIVIGITYFPFTDELFVAEKGKGATKNGQVLHVSSEAEISSMYAVSQMTSNLENRKLNLALYSELILKIRNIHVFNACIARGLTDLAEGIADFHFRQGFNYWDFAAGVLLVEEAGGKATDFDGNPIDQNTHGTLISNGKNHEGLLALVRESTH